jgi:hypothetical protein
VRQTLVFEFRPHWWWPTVRIAALGYAVIDRSVGEYALACLTPLGVKLFDISRSGGEARARFSIPLPGDQKTVGKAIDADIADLYFDLTPPTNATVRTRAGEIVFRSPAGPRRVDYVFSSTTGQLLLKTRFEGRRRINTIVFSDYRTERGRSYPATAVLKNHREGYALTLKVLSFR